MTVSFPIRLSLPAPSEPWTQELCDEMVGQQVPFVFMGHEVQVTITACELDDNARYAHMTLYEVTAEM